MSSSQPHNHSISSFNSDTTMKNYFHSSFGDTVLFRDWVITGNSTVFAFCLMFFCLAFTYEALRCFREFLLLKSRSQQARKSFASPGSPRKDESIVTASLTSERPSMSSRKTMLDHLFQSIFHALQVFISYTLMVGFMVMNVWICLSIAIGSGIGYLAFFHRRVTLLAPNEDSCT